MENPVPPGNPPTMKQFGQRGSWIVRGDPRGPLAHHWCNAEKCGIYRTERGAKALLAKLQDAYDRRLAYANSHATSDSACQ